MAERRSLEAPRRSEHEEHEGDAYDDAPYWAPHGEAAYEEGDGFKGEHLGGAPNDGCNGDGCAVEPAKQATPPYAVVEGEAVVVGEVGTITEAGT